MELPEKSDVHGEVLAAVARSRSVASGVLAACSMEPERALEEIALVVIKGLADCEAALTRLDGSRPEDLLLLLSAEHHWMEAMLEMLECPCDPAEAMALLSSLSVSLRGS